MRLPFLQIESDLLAHGGPEVAALAGCSLVQAIGHIAMIRAWAVSQVGEDAPPEGWIYGDASARRIEAAAQWTGERGALLRALIDAGQVSAQGSDHRILHLEPYRTAWERNAKAKARMANARERSANKREARCEQAQPGANEGAGGAERSAKFVGQREDVDVEAESTASQELAAAVQPPEGQGALFDQPKPPKPAKAPRKPSAAEELYQRIQDAREARCKAAGVHCVPDRWDNARQNKSLREVVQVREGEPLDADGRTETQASFDAAFAAYLGDERHRDKGWPLSLFIHGEVRSRYEQQALMGGAA